MFENLITFMVYPRNLQGEILRDLIDEESKSCQTCRKTYLEHGGLPLDCPSCHREHGRRFYANLERRSEALIRAGWAPGEFQVEAS